MSTGSINHSFFDGVGRGSLGQSLPPQAIPDIKKNDNWKKVNLDRLEHIGVSQLHKNMEFNDYYRMIRGELVLSDYGLPDITRDIVALRDECELPTMVKHYDFLGIIVNQIRGEYGKFKDTFRVDTIDPISQNEFVRDKTERVRQYAQQTFDLELQKKLIQNGINVDPNQQFNSDEERQQYIQMIEQKKAELIPPDVIQKDMSKNWKTKAAEWAEKTLEYDQQRFYMDDMNDEEITDYLLTGRFFRHYFIGYDYYKPERWSPMTTFFSEDIDAKFPQDGEYVGRIHYLSPSDVINRYGSKMTPEVQQRLSGYYNKSVDYITGGGQPRTFSNLLKGNFGQQHIVPFAGFYDYDITLQLQDAFDIPLGETTLVNEDGTTSKSPSWFSSFYNGDNNNANYYASQLRGDIDVRSDLLQVTEGYWRSFRRIGILNYTTKDGMPDQAIVTDDLIRDFLVDNEIKTLTRKTLEEIEENPEPNTIAFTYIPEVRWGVKVSAGNSFLNEDLYIGGDALEYQIKGDSNIYDVKLPVAGVIGNSTAKKLRPFIVMHNICMNQIFNLLEKELGTFLLFDVNYLPSEYKDNENTKATLEMLREAAVEIGIVPVDTKKQNLEGAGQGMNTFMTQTVEFSNQINSRIQLAERYKMQALEQIGITPQRIGSPSEYSTAEGIKQGMNASYAQTEPIFSVMSTANKKASEIHLCVAQYCQKNYKDVSYYYTKSDGDKAFIELSDPYFPLRNFGLLPTNNSKDKKELENLKGILFNMNTQGSDLLDFAEISKSDTLTGLIEIGKRNRLEKEKDVAAQREHEQTLVDKQITAQAQEKQIDREWVEASKERDRETAIEKEQIDSYGRAALSKDPYANFDRIDKATQAAITNGQREKELGIKQQGVDLKEKQSAEERDIEMTKLRIQLEDLQLKKEKMKSDEKIALINPQ